MDERTSHAGAPCLTVTVGTADPLHVSAGEDVVLYLPVGTCDSVVAALLGLVESPAIVVEIAGRSWAQRNAWEVAAQRGAMGWTFVRSAWLSNFSVLENVTLQARHHGNRPDAEIVATADDLAQRLGLPGIPRERPHLSEPDVLRRCEWVRALMHAPALLLLAQPERGAEAWADQLPALIDAACPEAARLWVYPQGSRPMVSGDASVREVDLTAVELPAGFAHLFE
jgi:ABC-type transporter Mla maintaining outer membrane lipid asymmetry ATPase subunit MlaF